MRGALAARLSCGRQRGAGSVTAAEPRRLFGGGRMPYQPKATVVRRSLSEGGSFSVG